MSQCCSKVPDEKDVRNIRDSIEDYFNHQTEGASAHGSSSAGETKFNNDGSITNISPYNDGDVIQSETFNEDGSIHYTTVNSETGVRHSYDVDINGNISNEHTTNQNVPPGHPDRHK